MTHGATELGILTWGSITSAEPWNLVANTYSADMVSWAELSWPKLNNNVEESHAEHLGMGVSDW
jgi:hypothetical protein